MYIISNKEATKFMVVLFKSKIARSDRWTSNLNEATRMDEVDANTEFIYFTEKRGFIDLIIIGNM